MTAADVYMPGRIGSFTGFNVIVSDKVPKDAFYLVGAGPPTLVVTDWLRFKVRWELHQYIDRRVREVRARLGL